MEQRQHDVEAQILDLTARTSPPRLVGELRGFARELLDGGYDRDRLYNDFLNAYDAVSERGQDEREDALLDVMDYLTGFCSPHARL